MKKRAIPLAGVLFLCLACVALGAGLAVLWLGGGAPQAPQIQVSPPPVQTSSPSPTSDTPSPTPTDETVPEDNPAMDDNGLPKDGVYVTDARAAYVSGSMRLIIPKLNVDVPVLNGVDSATLLQGVGLYDYAQLPSEGGANVSIAGHRNGLRGGQITDNMPFYYINTLTEGDYLYLTEGDTIYQYQWECTQVIEPDDWSVVYNRGYGCVTLTTCTPIGVADHRLVVRGELVETYPLSQDFSYPSDTGKE